MSLEQNLVYPDQVKDHPIDGIFDSAYFWDVDPKKVFIRKDARFVIDRIFRWSVFPGALDILDKYYSKKEIREEAMRCDSIYSNESFEILSKRYNISKEEFLHFRSF
ncbi:hypothetical protein [Pricia sp.]|uniref:DUF6922 domain-containing protein n=1 Tax=Pricia sp. TaxID=2268138 RepID=UPI0035944DDA